MFMKGYLVCLVFDVGFCDGRKLEWSLLLLSYENYNNDRVD